MRADLFLAKGGYAASRTRAQELIAGGCVTVDGRVIKKASEEIGEGEHTVSVEETLAYVSRGGLKLEAALDRFLPNLNGITALDVGASTGGFTDCLLTRGAARVYAVDAGVGQLAQRLREDQRVISKEKLNARNLSPSDINGEIVDLIVMDVSFISATYILPRFPQLLREGGRAICLIKPQFEVGRSMLGKGGIVKDPKAHLFAIERVMAAGEAVGLLPVGLIPSPVMGGDGNREFLICFAYGKTDQPVLRREELAKILR